MLLQNRGSLFALGVGVAIQGCVFFYYYMASSLPKKPFVIESYSVDVIVVESLPVYAPKTAWLRPVRVGPNQAACVLFNGRAWPLCVEASGALAIFTGGISFKGEDVRPPKLPLSLDLQFIEMPFSHALDPELGWKIERNQFGVYVFLNAPDDTVERVVQFLAEEKKYNVISWGDTVSADFAWHIRLSPGVSSDNVRRAVANALTSEVRHDEQQRRLLGNKIQELTIEIDKLRQVRATEKDLTTQQLDQVYQELLSTRAEVEELRKRGEKTALSDESDRELIRGKRHDRSDRVIAQILLNLYPLLAFSPDAIKMISYRFSESSALWRSLSDLNDGRSVRLEKLEGLAGQVGWCELQKHLATGSDARGRIYCRSSPRSHRFDVVIHWKHDMKEQKGLLRKLATYDYFPSPRSVLL